MNRTLRLSVAVMAAALLSSSTTMALAECSATWRSEPSLMLGRQRARACTDANGNIYVLGGSADQVFATVEMLSYQGGAYAADWVSLPDMPLARRDHAVACVGGFIYVIGGVTPGEGLTASVDRFDITAGVWETGFVPDLNTARVLHGAAVDDLGRIWVVGGYANPSDLASVEVLDPIQMELGWQVGPSLNQARTAHGISALPGGRIYAIGGMLQGGGGVHLDTLEVLDMNSTMPQWEMLAATLPPPISNTDLSVTGADDRIYILGGWLPGSTDRVLVFNPFTEAIEECSPISDALNHPAMTLGADGRIYRIGGEPAVFAGTTSVESLMTQPSDFEFECRILETPGNEDQIVDLPAGLDMVDMGRKVYAEIWARDFGDLNSGVTCAYADLDFADPKVSCGQPEITAVFDLFQSGHCASSMIDELGGCQLAAGIGLEPGWARVAVVPLFADATGVADLVLRPGDTESSAFGRGLVPATDIDYGTCSVEIVCPCSYDLDDNCNVAAGDLGLFAPCWSLCEGDPDWDANGCAAKDFDCNGCVSGGDLGWFAGSWQTACSEIDSMTAYPECRRCAPPVYCAGGPATIAGSVAGLSASSRAAEPVPSEPVVLALRTDLARPIRAGESIYAEVTALDTSPNSEGLTAVFADVQFNQEQFEVVTVDPGDVFTILSDPVVAQAEGVVRAVGGATMDTNHGAGQWTREAVIEFRALSDVLRPNFTIRPTPGEAVSRYGRGLVPDSEIQVLHGARKPVTDRRVLR